MVSLAQVSELRGDLGDALRIIDDAVRLADGSPGRLGHRFPVHDFRAYILITLGRLDEANSSLETGMRISEELGTRWALAHYHAGRALERFLAGHWDDAVAEIETDTGLAGAPGESYHHLLVRRGVLSLIRLHRNDLPGARVAHSRAQRGWPSLTPSEQAVVNLVAEGLSNPQIGQRLYVSRRTVQTHLAHVFAKLDITSRTQLAAEAIRHRG
jgi:DNA-binding CsgD family transcriptional regulator